METNQPTYQLRIESQPEALKLSFRNLMEPLLVLFNKAAGMELRNRPFYIAYSVPGGVYGYFGDHDVSQEELDRIYRRIQDTIVSGAGFRHEVLPTEKLLRYFEASQRTDIIHLINSRNSEIELEGLRLAHLNGYGELLLNHISENYDRLKNFKLTKFNKGFFLIADREFFQRVMPAEPTQSKYFRGFEETEETMRHLGVASFGELNDIISQGKLPDLIKLAEAYQARSISAIADQIISHPDQPRLIFLAGPTSSGKTTSANRLAIELRVLKKDVLILSLDNYYLPHSKISDDPQTGLKNFELMSALDLQLFRHNINTLLSGKPVFLPKYHFDGEGPKPETISTTIGENTYIIVEGIHGLNPGLWKDLMDMPSFRIYVSALNTLNIHDHLPLSTSDHRLIRRLVRDHLFRGYSINETIRRWPDVMQNEYMSIFPFQESAHALFNSALVYELAVFSHFASHIMDPAMAENEQIREEVRRLNRILSLLTPINPDDIPPTSILREFIGGSSFQYT